MQRPSANVPKHQSGGHPSADDLGDRLVNPHEWKVPLLVVLWGVLLVASSGFICGFMGFLGGSLAEKQCVPKDVWQKL